jgi:hypothetical protein
MSKPADCAVTVPVLSGTTTLSHVVSSRRPARPASARRARSRETRHCATRSWRRTSRRSPAIRSASRWSQPSRVAVAVSAWPVRPTVPPGTSAPCRTGRSRCSAAIHSRFARIDAGSRTSPGCRTLPRHGYRSSTRSACGATPRSRNHAATPRAQCGRLRGPGLRGIPARSAASFPVTRCYGNTITATRYIQSEIPERLPLMFGVSNVSGHAGAAISVRSPATSKASSSVPLLRGTHTHKPSAAGRPGRTAPPSTTPPPSSISSVNGEPKTVDGSSRVR